MSQYEVWIQNIERDSNYEKQDSTYLRDDITQSLEEAKEMALEIVEQKKVANVNTDGGKYIVRDEPRNEDVSRLVEPLSQGTVVYSAECLITFPKRFDPVYRTAYVVELDIQPT